MKQFPIFYFFCAKMMQVSVQELTPLAEWKLRHFDEGMGVIEMDSYNASVNKKGQRIDRQFPFGGKKHYYGFVDTNGIALSDFIYTWVGPFSEDRIAVTIPKGGAGWTMLS